MTSNAERSLDIQDRETGAPATDADDPGTAGTRPAGEVATSLGSLATADGWREMYLRLAADWGAICDAAGVEGDSSAAEIVAALRPPQPSADHPFINVDGVCLVLDCGLPPSRHPAALRPEHFDNEWQELPGE